MAPSPAWPHPNRPGRHGFPPKVARAILERDPWCVLALPGCDGPSAEADHIIPWRTALGLGWDQEMFDDPSNGQGLCRSCHAHKTATEAAAGRRQGRARRQRRHEPEQHPGIIEPTNHHSE